MVSRWKPPRQKPIRKPPQKLVPVDIGNPIEQEAFLNANPARFKAIEKLSVAFKGAVLHLKPVGRPHRIRRIVLALRLHREENSSLASLIRQKCIVCDHVSSSRMAAELDNFCLRPSLLIL